MSGQYPASVSSSALVAATGQPGTTMPPTRRTLAARERADAPLVEGERAAHPRIVEGLCLWLGVITALQFQSLVCTTILSPSSRVSSSRAEGGRPRNSPAARSARRASIRTACLGAYTG